MLPRKAKRRSIRPIEYIYFNSEKKRNSVRDFISSCKNVLKVRWKDTFCYFEIELESGSYRKARLNHYIVKYQNGYLDILSRREFFKYYIPVNERKDRKKC